MVSLECYVLKDTAEVKYTNVFSICKFLKDYLKMCHSFICAYYNVPSSPVYSIRNSRMQCFLVT